MSMEASSSEWRSLVQPESRHHIVNTIVEILKRHLPISGPEDLGELRKIAVQFEGNIYSAATSEPDYLWKISLKLLTMEKKAQLTQGCMAPNSLSSNPTAASQNAADPVAYIMQPQVRNQGPSIPTANQPRPRQQLLSQKIQTNIPSGQVQGSGALPPTLPSMMGLNQFAMSSLGQVSNMQTMLGQTVPTNIYPNSQRQMQGRHHQQSIMSQPHQQRVQNQLTFQQKQLLKQKIQQSSLLQSQIPQQQQFLQANQLQSSHQPCIQMSSALQSKQNGLQLSQPPVVQSASQSGLQQNKQNSVQWSASSLHQLPLYEKQIIGILNSNRVKITEPLGRQQFPQYGQNLPVAQPSQVPPLQQLGNHLNPMQSMALKALATPMQSTAMSSMQSGSIPLSSQVGVPTTQKNMMSSLQPCSNIESTSALSSVQQGAVGSLQTSQPHYSAGQCQTYCKRQNLQVQPPQISQRSFPQIDQQALLTSDPKSGTPLQSANSPSTLLAPSPLPVDHEKQHSGISSPSNVGTVGPLQASLMSAQSQTLAFGTPGISASALLAEITSMDGNQANASAIIPSKVTVAEQPLERIIKAVRSLSPTILASSVSDISWVRSILDSIAGTEPGNGSRAAVGEDLVAMTKCHMQARNFMSEDGNSATKKMKRHTTAMPLSAVPSAGKGASIDTSELESTATSRIKRQKTEANNALVEEIRDINQQLIDTMVDITDEDVGSISAAAESEGTIIKCTFCAVAVSPQLKSQFASAKVPPILTLRLIIPANYPMSSPVLLDKLLVEPSKYSEDLSVKAKSSFSASLRGLTLPISLKEMARTWDVCARKAMSEYAQQNEGSFSSRYGAWENCITA